MKYAGGPLALIALVLLAVPATAQYVPVPMDGLRYELGIRGQFTPQGMLIQAVIPGTEAERIGLARGDLIQKVDGQIILNQRDLASVVNSSGGSLSLQVRKARTERVVKLTLDLKGEAPRKGLPAPYLLGVAGVFRNEGLLVKLVAPGTPAARAGIQTDDLILRIDGKFVRNQAEFFTVLYNSGGQVTLDLRRGSTGRVTRLTVDLKLYEFGALGEFTREGMLLATVAPGTPAERAGLQRGDLLVQIDGVVPKSQSELDRLIRKSGGTLNLVVRRGGPRGVLARVAVDIVNNPLQAWCEPATEGMRIINVATGGPADQNGLTRGDVIIKVDDRKTRTKQELNDALAEAGVTATLTVRKADTNRLTRIDILLAR